MTKKITNMKNITNKLILKKADKPNIKNKARAKNMS